MVKGFEAFLMFFERAFPERIEPHGLFRCEECADTVPGVVHDFHRLGSRFFLESAEFEPGF